VGESDDPELEETGLLHEEVLVYLEFWAIAADDPLDALEHRLALDGLP
jgi:hypothetical protein